MEKLTLSKRSEVVVVVAAAIVVLETQVGSSLMPGIVKCSVQTDESITDVIVVFIAAHSARIPAATLAAVFFCVQSVLDASGVNSQTDGEQHLQVHRSVSAHFCLLKVQLFSYFSTLLVTTSHILGFLHVLYTVNPPIL